MRRKGRDVLLSFCGTEIIIVEGNALLKAQCVLELMSGHMPLPVAQFLYTLRDQDKALTPQSPEQGY